MRRNQVWQGATLDNDLDVACKIMHKTLEVATYRVEDLMQKFCKHYDIACGGCRHCDELRAAIIGKVTNGR